MHVRFLGRMPQKGYSGGRLLALTLAESLAQVGVQVDFLVDQLPEMYDEFKLNTRILMRRVVFNDLSSHVNRDINVVIVVPNFRFTSLHRDWAKHASDCQAKLVLLNFESPNWFNEVSPFKRPVAFWDGWQIVAKYADLILSLSAEGNRYAREFFHCKSACAFDFIYTAINSILADEATTSVTWEKRIVMLSRADPHKGYNDLAPLICSDLSGYRVSLFLGMGKMPQHEIDSWQFRFSKVGMMFEVRPPIIGIAKFELLKRSALLYFPSRFEGFGIPPLEAAYCRLPCACHDLPVLREYGGGAFSYGDADDESDMRRAVLDGLSYGVPLLTEFPRLCKIARMKDCGQRLRDVLSRII